MTDGTKNRMKVCVVSADYYRSSGVTVAIKRIYRGVLSQGVDQQFVGCDHKGKSEDVEWMPLGMPKTFRLMTSNPVHLVSQLRAFLRWLRSEHIPVVHVHHRRLAVLLRPMQRFGGFRLVYTAQLSYPFAFWFWLAGPRRAVAISESVAANLRATTRNKRIDVIGNPSDFPEHCPAESGEGAQPSVICVARLDPVKGHTHLISAWKLLADRGIPAKLVLLGEGALKETLQAQVRDLGLERLVEFRGFQQDVGREIERCRFAVLASQVEGHPLVVIEVAARGLATLVTDVDGSRDCVPPDQHLPNRIPFGDAPALADALAAWIGQPDLVVGEGRAFYDFHKERHSTEVVGKKYADLYRSCAE